MNEPSNMKSNDNAALAATKKMNLEITYPKSQPSYLQIGTMDNLTFKIAVRKNINNH